MSLDKTDELSKDILSHLKNSAFCDVTIEASDGAAIPANKVILSMRSQYFNSMFSTTSNFVESRENSVKMPYSKIVLDKVLVYLYSGKMDFEDEDLSLRSLMDLVDLLKLMNLQEESSSVENYIKDYLRGSEGTGAEDWPFSSLECLKVLDYSSKLGQDSVGEALLSFLGKSLVAEFSGTEEVRLLSEAMIIRLIEEEQCSCCDPRTFHKFKTLVNWLSVNTMDEDKKEKALLRVDFEDFTIKELQSDVKNSGLYPVKKIRERVKEIKMKRKEEWKAEQERRKENLRLFKEEIKHLFP